MEREADGDGDEGEHRKPDSGREVRPGSDPIGGQMCRNVETGSCGEKFSIVILMNSVKPHLHVLVILIDFVEDIMLAYWLLRK